MRLHFGRPVGAALLVLCGIGLGLITLGLSGANAANLDEACGGPNHITCNSALYCQLPAGQCSAADVPGVCAKAPDFCMRVSRPVCGCNGKTYMNECEARKARVAIDTYRRLQEAARGRRHGPGCQARGEEKEEARQGQPIGRIVRKRGGWHRLTTSSAATRLPGAFPKRCCFQVIYFVRNISLPSPSNTAESRTRKLRRYATRLKMRG